MLKEGSCTERESWKSAEDPSLVFSRVLINIYMGGNYLRSRKELFKKKIIIRLEVMEPGIHILPRRGPDFTSCTGKISQFRALSRVLRKVSTVENN